VSANPAQPSAAPEGLLVVGTTPGGPSAEAGLQEGDIITKLDDRTATSAEQILALTLTRRPGETVKVSYLRDGAEHTTELTLGSQPAA
jgi:putative serine protease PepD